MKIIRKDDVDKFTKNYNFQSICELNDDLVLIKYNSRMNEKIRNLYKNDLDKIEDGVKNGLYKKRGIPSSVQIAAAISAYARISINKYKNIQNNTCYYSDTDSVILRYNLDNNVGDEIGQMKLEYFIEEGIIIRKKLYALKTKDKGLIVKSSGVNPYKLTYANFKELLENKTVEVQTNTFNVDWSKVKINYLPRIVKLKGIYMQDHKVASDDPPVPPHPLGSRTGREE